MWLRAFCPQACYAGGPGRFRYLLYKDVNRPRHAQPAALSESVGAHMPDQNSSENCRCGL